MWGRDPFAKGSPPPRPHPLKPLLWFSVAQDAFYSDAGVPMLRKRLRAALPHGAFYTYAH
ncbi:hypothetical protein KL86DES1_10948 [uncultured Desulfovibrio sp.]|uniref:Uncharacterized protein n=1 Tax=uncultured Desulfovibrio sp. TaxID=167968 RepID=A0A212L148_9BACT|nr:hypothetical protein KL86DES1_10948 [uncultured Desulfovibrio sp.]VZH32820.1 conserved protein of unknown function [Desulfovibrio sp. 86]